MSEASQTWTPPTFEDLPSAISSPDSESGVTASDSPDGPMTDLFGQAVVLAPASPLQEKARGLETLVTSGHIGYASSGSAALQRSLESRLQQRLDTAGSTLFTLTWKRRRTPLGRSYLERAASVRRTSGKDCISSVHTPNLDDCNNATRDSGNFGSLVRDVNLATVPTPMSGSPSTETYNAAGNNDYSRKMVELATVATPRSEDSQCTGAHRGTADTLHSQTNLCSVASPSARDWKDTSGMSETGVDPDGSIRTRLDQLPQQAQLADSGATATGGTPATKSTGQLNPEYSRWLMGLPIEFSNCVDTAMQSWPRKRQCL